LARTAIILHEGSPGPKELRLSRILEFFGIPFKEVDVSKLADLERNSLEYAVFGSIQAVAAALNQKQRASLRVSRPAAFYAYADSERDLSVRALRSLIGDANLSLQEAPAGNHSLCVSRELADTAGPMAGLTFSLPLRGEDSVLIGAPTGGESMFATLISAGGAPVFLRFRHQGIPVYFCTSSQIVDIDQSVGRGFYDVKDHFCSVVPLVMFIRFIFPDVAWRPQELGACLIIDDPLLKPQYGFCNFENLRDLMRQHGFTTNIAFIPWNWRRTSPAAGDFFRNEAGLFSLSIHGCDHTSGEFGTISLELLHTKARLAQSRMRNHEARTGIHHDSVMVFPQGVFSSVCPEVLKRNGFLAAVNTELVPVDSQNAHTRIRDVWDVAIMTYSGFPIFTRRYAFHGLENFAFDLLLGKPCLIVAHHDFFKDGGAGVLELIEKIGSLNCSLHWRPLGEVIRRSCRRRTNGAGSEVVQMYGSELLIGNTLDQAIEMRILKRKSQEEVVSEILCDGKPVSWVTEDEQLVIGERIPPRNEKCFRVVYREQAPEGKVSQSLSFELSVATRRFLSEFRDDYLSRSRFLSASAEKLRSALKKAN
jgi:hypothetical protein